MEHMFEQNLNCRKVVCRVIKGQICNQPLFRWNICKYYPNVLKCLLIYQLCVDEVGKLSKVKPSVVSRPELIPVSTLSMKGLGEFLLLPWLGHKAIAGLAPQHWIRLYLLIQLREERHCESKVSCPRTQRSAPGKARTPTAGSGVQCNKL